MEEDISDISVSSVHTSNLSHFEQCDSYSKNKVEEIRVRQSIDAHGWSNKTTQKIERFAEETGANETTDDHSQIAFLFQVFKEETLQTNANQTNEYARQKI